MSKIQISDGDVAVFNIDGKEVHVSKMMIDAAKAEELISDSDRKFRNRKTNASRFSLYAKDMQDGNWKVNGETLKFRKDGACIDGRHRLFSVCKANIEQDFLVISNLENGVEDTIDIGTQRSLEHALQFQGIAYETGAGAIVRLKMQLDNKYKSNGANDGVLKMTRVSQVEEFKNHHTDYMQAVEYGKFIHKETKGLLGRSEVGGLYMHLIKTLGYDRNIVEDFFNKLITTQFNSTTIFGTTMAKLGDKQKCRGVDRTNEFIMCFNSYRKGNEKKRVSIDEYDGWFVKPDGTNY